MFSPYFTSRDACTRVAEGDATGPGNDGPGKVWSWRGDAGVGCGEIVDGAFAHFEFLTQRGYIQSSTNHIVRICTETTPPWAG